MTVKIMIFCLGIVAVLGAVLLLILSKKQSSYLVMQQSIAELLRTEKLCRNCKVVQLFESGEQNL